LEVDVQQGNFKILWLLPQVLILFLVEKWIPPNRSETAKLVKKTEGILGVNALYEAVLVFFKSLNRDICKEVILTILCFEHSSEYLAFYPIVYNF
jgi:hypothetical protein